MPGSKHADSGDSKLSTPAQEGQHCCRHASCCRNFLRVFQDSAEGNTSEGNRRSASYQTIFNLMRMLPASHRSSINAQDLQRIRPSAFSRQVPESSLLTAVDQASFLLRVNMHGLEVSSVPECKGQNLTPQIHIYRSKAESRGRAGTATTRGARHTVPSNIIAPYLASASRM